MNHGEEPAFPTDYNLQSAWKGLTKRQWYAGKALQGLIINPATCRPECPISARAFELADVMIEFEEKENGTKENN